MRNFLFAATYAERHRKDFFGLLAIAPRDRSDRLRGELAEFRDTILLPGHRDRIAFVEYERYIELLAVHGNEDGKDLASFLRNASSQLFLRSDASTMLDAEGKSRKSNSGAWCTVSPAANFRLAKQMRPFMERTLLIRFEAGAYKWGPDLNWTDCLNVHRSRHKDADGPPLVGVLPGEGVGPEVINAALEVLCAVVTPGSLEIEICEVGCIGREAEQIFGTPLPEDVIRFCDTVFTRGGAILHGPAGGRFVHNLRNQFDLFFKISPLQIGLGVPQVSRLKPETLRGLDILVTRENSGGIYQGRWEERADLSGDRLARHYFEYSEKQVRRFLHASARLAKQRRGDLTVVWKESGLPSISKLWRACAEEAAMAHGVRLHMVNIDLMAYRLVHEPQAFDVIAAPNLFGDILADLGAVLLGSRGVSFSGNYSETGASVYQTNHGSAFNLAGTDRANPAGQIFSVAMMLRESFGLSREATAIEEATRSVWLEGWRTEDVAVPGARIVGTREMGSRVAEQAAAILESHQPPTGTSVGDEATAHPR